MRGALVVILGIAAGCGLTGPPIRSTAPPPPPVETPTSVALAEFMACSQGYGLSLSHTSSTATEIAEASELACHSQFAAYRSALSAEFHRTLRGPWMTPTMIEDRVDLVASEASRLAKQRALAAVVERRRNN